MNKPLSRRVVLGSLVSGGLLAGCGRLDQTAPAKALLDATDRFTFRAQRLLLAPDCGLMTISRSLAREKLRVMVEAARQLRRELQ